MTATITAPDALLQEDVGNITLLEHVNVQIDDQAKATLFYIVGLGFTRDPHMMVGLENMWVNVGEQQFHLPTSEHVNVLRGHVGLVTPNLDALAERLKSIEPRLEGTKFSWARKDGYIEAISPWGNVHRLYEPAEAWGPITVGMPYVEFTVPEKTAEGILRFYQEAMGCNGRITKDSAGKAAEIDIGQYQRLIYRESKTVEPYDGHHIAVYVANFSRPYQWLAERGLITEEPRNHQFRFVDIVDPETGEKLFEIEHEVRSMKHTLFRRELVNRTVGQFLEPRRINGQTVMGMVG